MVASVPLEPRLAGRTLQDERRLTVAEPTPMPTLEDYASAREALSRAFDELDHIRFLFDKNLGEDADGQALNPTLDPSAADIGYLFSFVEDVRLQVADFSRFESRLGQYLRDLDGLRLDLEAARRHNVAA